jgi:hypothetical protein
MGERDVFPFVGASTQIRLQGARGSVYPLVTGTFGGVDFLHSVMGEVSDKATQSEIQELEGTISHSGRADNSKLKELLNSIPKGLFGNKDEASAADEVQANATAAQMSNVRVSPRQPEAFTIQMQEVATQIYPIIEWHDEIMLGITTAIEKIPILPDILEQLQEQLSIYVFSLIAPFVLPIISSIKTELEHGSSEVIQSSKAQQLNVFHDQYATDPTHSMLSKDHFSNVSARLRSQTFANKSRSSTNQVEKSPLKSLNGLFLKSLHAGMMNVLILVVHSIESSLVSSITQLNAIWAKMVPPMAVDKCSQLLKNGGESKVLEVSRVFDVN